MLLSPVLLEFVLICSKSFSVVVLAVDADEAVDDQSANSVAARLSSNAAGGVSFAAMV